jgi:hypothetical protein
MLYNTAEKFNFESIKDNTRFSDLGTLLRV